MEFQMGPFDFDRLIPENNGNTIPENVGLNRMIDTDSLFDLPDDLEPTSEED